MLKWTKRVYQLAILAGVLVLVLAAFFCNTKQFSNSIATEETIPEDFYSFKYMENIEHTTYKIPEDTADGNYLAIFTLNMEIWVVKDGKPAFYETLGDGMYNNTTGSSWHFIYIPPTDAGLTVDIYTHFTYPEPFNYIKKEPVLRFGQMRDIYTSSAIRFAFALFVGVTLAVLGVVYIIISQTVIRSARRNAPNLDNSVLYLGLFSLLLGLFTGNQFHLSSLYITNGIFNSMLSGMPLALMLPAFSFYMRELYKTSAHRALNTLCVVNTVISLVSVLLQLFDIADLFQTLGATHIAVVASTVIAAGMAVREVRCGRATKVMRSHLVPIIVCFICALIDTACHYIGTADNDMFGRLGFLYLIFYSGFSSLHNARRLLVESKESELYKRLATSDTLTGLPNRTALVFGLTDYERMGRKRCGFFMMDLNNLKECNDTMGHLAGDDYLRVGASIIEEAFSGYGTAYRIGGDEFVVVVREPDKERTAACISALERLQHEHNTENHAYPIGIAWGYAEYSREMDSSYDDTLSRADRHMYELKRGMKPRGECQASMWPGACPCEN